MDLHHLHVFHAAAREKSFTEAARLLSLSQSTVSLHIKELEAEFGCALFSRKGKQKMLTGAGLVLLEHVERLFAEIRGMELAVKEYATSERGTIRFGVGATTLIYMLPDILAEYRRQFSQIEVLITTAVTESLVSALVNRTIDLAVVMTPSEPVLSASSLLSFIQEEIVVVLPIGHPLSARDILTPRDLDGLAMISHLRGTAMHTLQQGYLESMGVQPRFAMELENIEAIKSLVIAGMGGVLLPICSVKPPFNRGLVHNVVRGFPMFRSLSLAANDWYAQPPAVRNLASLMLLSLASPTAIEQGEEVLRVGSRSALKKSVSG